MFLYDHGGLYSQAPFFWVPGPGGRIGDFVLTGSEVNPVIQALVGHSIMVTGGPLGMSSL